MHGSRSKSPVKKNSVRQRGAEGFNSGVKELKINISLLFIKQIYSNNREGRPVPVDTQSKA
jgi:hypothetical protein